jgi:hypothetical protein
LQSALARHLAPPASTVRPVMVASRGGASPRLMVSWRVIAVSLSSWGPAARRTAGRLEDRAVGGMERDAAVAAGGPLGVEPVDHLLASGGAEQADVGAGRVLQQVVGVAVDERVGQGTQPRRAPGTRLPASLPLIMPPRREVLAAKAPARR